MKNIQLGDIREDGRVYSDVYDGHPRWLDKRICSNKNCGKEFLTASHRKGKFCSPKCQGENRQNKIEVKCDTCGVTFLTHPSDLKKAKHGYHFCSRVCKEKAQSLSGNIIIIRPPHYGNSNGLTTYRERAFKKYGIVCSKCQYREDDRMLDVHHKDGNRSNNKIDNLEVLCVWCHALETRKNWPHFS